MSSKSTTQVRGTAIWMDGKLVPWDDANVHILTHTLHYGLGVFEGIRCYRTAGGGSAVFRLGEHVRRLFESAHINLMTVPFTQAQIAAAIGDTLRANEMREGYIRPLVYIGHGAMGLNPGDNPIRVAIATWPWGKYLGDEGVERGIRAKISTFSRHHVNAKMTKGKTCGDYVNSILAKREARSTARRSHPARHAGSSPRRAARTSSSCATAQCARRRCRRCWTASPATPSSRWRAKRASRSTSVPT
jgi:branched-chain amino acid aminotransferase